MSSKTPDSGMAGLGTSSSFAPTPPSSLLGARNSPASSQSVFSYKGKGVAGGVTSTPHSQSDADQDKSSLVNHGWSSHEVDTNTSGSHDPFEGDRSASCDDDSGAICEDDDGAMCVGDTKVTDGSSKDVRWERESPIVEEVIDNEVGSIAHFLDCV